jgi:hypothetical protein
LERKTKAEQKKGALKSKIDQSSDEEDSAIEPGMVSQEPAQVQAQQSYDFENSTKTLILC